MDYCANRKVDPSSPLILICLFCENIFFGKRGEVAVDLEQAPAVKRECPLCKEIPLQLLGLHPGAWAGIKVAEESAK